MADEVAEEVADQVADSPTGCRCAALAGTVIEMGTNQDHNLELRSARLRIGQTQRQLAETLTRLLHNRVIEAAYIGRLERGQVHWPGAEVREVFRTYFDVKSDADLGFYPLRVPDPRQESMRLIHADESRETKKSMAMPKISRTLRESAKESSDLLAWVDMTNVGDLTIEQIEEDLRRITASYLRVSTGPILDRILALRARVVELLRNGRQKPMQSRKLYSVAGWCSTLLGWISIDLSNFDVAQDHLRVAWAFGDNADEDDLKAWIRGTQHTFAFWQDDFEQASRYAQDGLRYATSTTGSAELFLTGALALDLARSGRTVAALDVLGNAQQIAETSCDVTDRLAGPFTCNIGRSEGFWSDTHLAAKDWQKALAYADTAIQRFENSSAEQRNLGSERMVRCQQVKAHLLAGEFDGAVSTLQPILATAPEHRVRPLMHRVAEIAQLTTPHDYSEPKQIAEMRDAIVTFQSTHSTTPVSLDTEAERDGVGNV